jgi:tetratricopeptide (TPR) repeat protein
MAVNRKYGINPRLISLITGQNLSEIPESPTASMLPGSYGQIIAKKINKIPLEYSENIHLLTCTRCGYNGKYNLGLVVIDHKKYQNMNQGKFEDEGNESPSLLECFQATGYFRCRQCNAAGYWEFPNQTKIAFYLGSISAVIFHEEDLSKQRFAYGAMVLADGSRHRWATDIEEHYLNKLTEHPEDAFTWNRLANSYLKGGRPDLAAVAFEESLKIDPGQAESLYSLGKLLYDAGENEAAVRYLCQTLIYAQRYDRMKAEDMRDMLTVTLQILFDIHNDIEKLLSALPTASEILPPGENLGKLDAIVHMDLDIYPDDPSSFYPLAEMYMGKRLNELPPEAQTLYKNAFVNVKNSGKMFTHPKEKRKKKTGKKKKRKK